MRSLGSTVIVVGVAAAVIVTWLGFGYVSWNDWRKPAGDVMAHNGQYGDSFGSVNALFSGLAFVALVNTLILQQRQIKRAGDASGTAQFFELTRYLDEHRDDRRNVFALAESKGSSLSWTLDEQQIAEKVCAGFNLAGILAQEDEKLKKLVVESWAYSASKSYVILRDLVNERRRIRGPEYVSAFEWLANQIAERGSSKTPTPPPARRH
jgi:hypothetical protein